MSKREPFTYVLLRYRHDPLAGEFANVGVVLHAPKHSFLGVRVRKTLGRLGKIFPGISRAELSSSLHAIERSVRSLAPKPQIDLLPSGLTDAAKIAMKGLPRDDSSYIWSELFSGITDDPTASLDRIYDRFVGRYDEESVTRRDDASVWQPVRESLSAQNLLDRLQPKTIVSPLDEVEFDSAWKNGAWHCYQALSFDLTTAEGIRAKAARWSGHMLGISKAEEKIVPHFLVGAPSDETLVGDYRKAVEFLKASALEPIVFDETQIDELVSEIVEDIRAHDSHVHN